MGERHWPDDATERVYALEAENERLRADLDGAIHRGDAEVLQGAAAKYRAERDTARRERDEATETLRRVEAEADRIIEELTAGRLEVGEELSRAAARLAAAEGLLRRWDEWCMRPTSPRATINHEANTLAGDTAAYLNPTPTPPEPKA